MTEHKKTGAERRKHRRFSVVEGMVEPITLELEGPDETMKKQPAIMTDLAVELAEKLGAEIASADSRQVYRRLDAGTAKPGAAQRARVRHWLLDCADPSEAYDAARWAKEAAAAIADIRARGKIALVC